MNSVILIIPLFLIRYGIPKIVNKNVKSNISYFTPMVGVEKIMYIIYQISTLIIIVTTFFLNIKIDRNTFIIGLIVYVLGIILFTLSTYSFEKYSISGLSRKGMYKFSRNPMYLSYFIYFLGIVILTKSIFLFAIVLLFQVSSHFIILSEERWCIEKYGEEYIEYMESTKRYI